MPAIVASSGIGSSPEAIRVAKNMARWYKHPWHMVQDGKVYTLDSVDYRTPVKPLPPYPWLKVTTQEWLDNKLLLVPKSRRMQITWLMACLHLWLAMFHPGMTVFLVSDKEEKSDELVRRCEFILDNIPDTDILKPKKKSRYCYLGFPGINSYIRGIPQGASQLRQYTASAILFDEFAFWESGQKETLGAARPTLEGGGRLTIVSSVLEGPWKELVFDETM